MSKYRRYKMPKKLYAYTFSGRGNGTKQYMSLCLFSSWNSVFILLSYILKCLSRDRWKREGGMVHGNIGHCNKAYQVHYTPKSFWTHAGAPVESTV